MRCVVAVCSVLACGDGGGWRCKVQGSLQTALYAPLGSIDGGTGRRGRMDERNVRRRLRQD